MANGTFLGVGARPLVKQSSTKTQCPFGQVIVSREIQCGSLSVAIPPNGSGQPPPPQQFHSAAPRSLQGAAHKIRQTDPLSYLQHDTSPRSDTESLQLPLT